MEIRPERDSDAEAILAVTRAAFAPEGEAEVALVDLLRSRGKAVISLVATEGVATEGLATEGVATGVATKETATGDDRVVGHVLFTKVTVEPDDGGRRLLGMAPLSVDPSHQGRGIGSGLVKRGLEDCRSAGCDAVVVLGEPDYYGRFGFEKASAYGLANEYGVDDPFMVVPLRPGALDGLSGTARYEPEFLEVDA